MQGQDCPAQLGQVRTNRTLLSLSSYLRDPASGKLAICNLDETTTYPVVTIVGRSCPA